MNKVYLLGRVGKDAVIREGKSKFAHFTLATSESYKVGDDWKTETEWHSISAFGKVAEACVNAKKGAEVFVEGKLRTSAWKDKDGNDQKDRQVVAINLRVVGAAKNAQPQPEQKSFMEVLDSDDDIPF